MKARLDLFTGIVPFVRCAEQQSFSRAAADLGISTAAVSKAIKKLEEDLGVSLFERSSRVVKLTRAGTVFLDRCRPAVLGVQGARDAVHSARREPQGEIAVTLPTILAGFVVPSLARLGAHHPRLVFRINLSDHLAHLADENFDVAIRMGELEDSALVSRALRRTRWVTVASPGYLGHRPAPKNPRDLEQHNCLRFLGPNGRARSWSFQDGGRDVRVRVDGNLVIDNGDQLLAAARSGMGVCQALDFMLGDAVERGQLVEVLTGFSAPGPPVHALTTRGRAGQPNVRAFLRFLVEAFA
jgi:DNA-binding transcriptional LysR family regulator